MSLRRRRIERLEDQIELLEHDIAALTVTFGIIANDPGDVSEHDLAAAGAGPMPGRQPEPILHVDGPEAGPARDAVFSTDDWPAAWTQPTLTRHPGLAWHDDELRGDIWKATWDANGGPVLYDGLGSTIVGGQNVPARAVGRLTIRDWRICWDYTFDGINYVELFSYTTPYWQPDQPDAEYQAHQWAAQGPATRQHAPDTAQERVSQPPTPTPAQSPDPFGNEAQPLPGDFLCQCGHPIGAHSFLPGYRVDCHETVPNGTGKCPCAELTVTFGNGIVSYP